MKISTSKNIRVIFPLYELAAPWAGPLVVSVIDGKSVDFGYIEISQEAYASAFKDLVTEYAPLYTLVIAKDGSVASFFFDHESKSYETSILGTFQTLEWVEASSLGKYFSIGADCFVVGVESDYPEDGYTNKNKVLH